VSSPDPVRTIDELLDRAIDALNSGDRATADALAEQVLGVDSDNKDAGDLLAAPAAGSGELRRLTIVFADVVDSTALSSRIEPEIYRTVIGRYRQQVNDIINRYEGHVFSTKGDGLLAVFGHPRAHEDDVRRGVQASLDITREVASLSDRVRSRFGFEISVRVGVHRGLVYLDVAQDDVYGLGANLASRVSGLAPPGAVVVSGAIAPLARDYFDLKARPAQTVKGVEEPVDHYQVVGERVSPARIPLGPLVGRNRELAHVQKSWEMADNGSLETPGVVFVGEAGVGKSRLSTVAADLAEQSGNPVLALIGSPFHTDAGLYPIRALLEHRCGIERATEQAERLRLLRDEVRASGLEPESAIPLLAPVLGIADGYTPVRAEGAKLYERIAQAIRSYLLARAGAGPAVLLAEDLQWFDPSTLDVVKSLLDTNSGRLLVVITARNADSLGTIGRAHVQVFELAPLSSDEADELIAALDPTLSPAQRTEVARRCDGVPLYLEEVVTKMHDQPADAVRWARVPDALYEPLFSRLRASDTTILVVEAAATIGREFDRDIMRSVLDMTDADLGAAIQELETARVFEPTAVETWRFRHELLREVAYELPPPSMRRRLHSRVADALVAASDDPDWRLVAVHYEHAERFEEAADAHRQAASDARRRGALEEARAYLTRAIAQIKRVPTSAARDVSEVRLRLRRGFLASAAEGTASPQAAKDFERCLQLAGTDLREAELYSTLTALWAYYLPRGDVHRALQVSMTVRRRVMESGRLSPQVNDAGVGMVAWYLGDFAKARSVLEEAMAAVAGAEIVDYESVWFVPNEPIASIHTHLALARFVQGDLAGAEEQLAETVHRVAMLGFPQGPFSHAYERCYEIWMRIEAGQLDRAAEIVGELNVQAARHGFDFWVLIGATQQAAISALQALAASEHDPDTLRPHIKMMTMFVQSWRAAEAKLFVTFYDGVLARLLTAAGDIDKARERLDTALNLGQATGADFYRAELLRLRAHTTDNVEARDADLRAAIDTARTQSASIFELRSAIDSFELNGEPSRGALVAAIGRFPAGSGWPELARARALLA
jgi:class 3 adenylate cyclase/tetratricopeptide (TPR) repeat protein